MVVVVSRRILEDILREPLGPYRDSDILDEVACQMKGATRLVLYSFVLERAGRIVGLDESETPLPGGRDDRRFRFRGVLKIADPDWLSEAGLKTVEMELNLRARERAMRLGEGTRQVNGMALTLEGLFESGQLVRSKNATREGDDGDDGDERDGDGEGEGETKLEVVLQGEKGMPAVYMHSTRVPHGLLWNSKAHNRNYRVASMDIETFVPSKNFFWRWNLLALMDKITKRHPWMRLEKRTPGWFVERYLATCACPEEDKWRRTINDPEDSDVDESGRTKTPRHLLVPHASEVLGLLATHAEWLITNNEVKQRRLFDESSWTKFSKVARRQRKEAAGVGVRWGWPEGQAEYAMSEEGEEGDGEGDDEDRLARENPVIGKSNEAVARKIRLARARGERVHKGGGMSSDSASDEDEEVAPRGNLEYVSDFSDPSDAEEDEEDGRAAEEEAAEQIPWQLQMPPYLPDVDGRWWCPLRECDHEIDLYDLTEEQGRTLGVPEEVVEYIVQKQWRNAAYDEKVLQGFKCMVTAHYVKHFEARGVRAEKKDGRTRFVFIDGARRRRRGPEVPIRGPMPPRGTLRGEARVVPNVHAPQEDYF